MRNVIQQGFGEENAMEYAGAELARETKSGIEHTMSKAFRTAHLLTASIEQAERAVIAAMDSWEPDGGDEALFHQVVYAAVRAQVRDIAPSPGEPDSTAFLPTELQAVIHLSPELRNCFVLRILVGMSRQACARLLDLHCRQVDEYTCAALKRLPAPGAGATGGAAYLM